MRYFFVFCLSLLLAGCGFHLQGEANLAPPLHRMYLQAPDPYGYLVRNLKQYLKMSRVQLVPSPTEATTQLIILRDDESQEFVTVSSTNQTRVYRLRLTVTFEIADAKGRVLLEPQTMVEERMLTMQSNQILGNSNEATLMYQQMRRVMAYILISRIASKDVTKLIEDKIKQ